MATQQQSATGQKVIIIGAGLAGLALGQGLKHANPPIPFHIFERDSSAAFRAQGYRIRISAGAALQKLLPDALWDAFETTSAGFYPGMASLNALTAERNQMARPPPTVPGRGGMALSGEEKAYNCDRAVLRNLLLKGLEDHVSFGKQLQGYSVSDTTGTVEVRFADGTVNTGSILIGADGVRSVVRRSFMPDFKVLDTEGRAVFGKTECTPQFLSLIPSEFTSGICVATPDENSPVKLFCDIMQFTRRGEAKDLGFDLPRDYLYWVLLFRQDQSDPDNRDPEGTLQSLLSLDDKQSAQKAADLTSGWHDKIRAIVDLQDVPSTSTLAVFTCMKDDFDANWRAVRSTSPHNKEAITLLGDAAHPMTPVGGVGANSAFQEAADLLDALLGIHHSHKSSAEELAAYEEKMRERGLETVDRSVRGAKHFFSMKSEDELRRVTM